ncbi:MAG: GGDEF domain-containing protein [Arcobacteraceae bacterium]|jgi:diguanylate cyclase (GGDEF)-like protein|nr:GGDEF domain-containing protein [Arcobacteraceae bacterium]
MKHSIDNQIFSVINAIPNPVIIMSKGHLKGANKAFLDFFAISSIDEFNTLHGSIANLFVKNNGFFVLSDIKNGEYWTDYLCSRPDVSRIVSIKNTNGDLIDFEITLKKIEHKSEYIIVFNDITTYIAQKNEYEYFAYHDHLTKIFNRQKFDELLLKEFENKKRYGDKLSVILIDLDHFKKVNDTYGHLTGDLVLIAIVGIIRNKLRINDVFARWGGEEFIILLPRTNINDAYAKAEELRKDIESYIDKELPPVTISAGVSELTDKDDIASCLKRVDTALYLAKVKRNDVVKVVD